jgi:hypothetical protein
VIDDSDSGAWAQAMLPTWPSLKILTDAELHAPDLIAKVQQSHACETMADALEIVAAEKRRRIEQTAWDGRR